jgi:hypothetical protein
VFTRFVFKPRHVRAAQFLATTLSEAINFCAENKLPAFPIRKTAHGVYMDVPRVDGGTPLYYSDWLVDFGDGLYYVYSEPLFTELFEPGGEDDRRLGNRP